MADPQGGETIRQMLAGFNSMQMQLGLLPMQNQASPMGVPFQPPPPPPQVPHPSQSGVYAVAQQQQQMQQTLQAAQMNRFVPPPSTPIGGGGGGGFGWGGSMNTLASSQFNPILAGVMSGGGGGMPSPMMMTAPQYGGYRPGGPMSSPMMGPSRVPSVFNPFSPALPGSHFMSPAMQHLQVMQAHQSQFTGMLGGAVQGGLGLGGSMIGSGLGMAVGGPLGSMVGSYLGGKIGGGIGDMTIGPALADMAHGRQLQNMSAPWMVSGGMLNPFTGQGMERGAARQTASGLRHLVRDQEFEKTGFNTQDVMRITQLASDQGLLTTARNPEDLTRKVKDISKAIKNIIAITGDPDVRDAIQSLGQMRNLGFMGLSGQMGAVVNRTAFSRMAGVSQSAMDQQFGAPGAMMGQQLGLSGATGYMAGMGGGGFANVAASSGALNELQLAKAGGRQGLGTTNTMAALGAANQDLYMASSIRRGKGGKWSVDVDAYRQAQGMDIDEVARRAGSNLHASGMGIADISTRRQEFKDILAQSISPAEMQLNVIKQATAMSRKTGLGLGASFKTMLKSQGRSDEEAEVEARSLELEAHSGKFYEGIEQQIHQQGRDAQDRVRARRDRYRTPGVAARMGHGIREGMGEMGDWFSSPFAAMGEHTDRAAEDRALQGRGEYAHRYRQSQLIDSPQARQMAISAMGRQSYRQNFGQLGSDPFATGGGFGNTFAHSIGYSAYDDANAMNDLANRSDTTAFGMHPFSSFGDVGRSRRRVASVSRVAESVDTAMNMTGDKRMAMHRHINESAKLSGMKNFDASTFAQQASVELRKLLPTAGGIGNAGAAREQHFIQAVRNAARQNGQDEDEAVRAFLGNDKGQGMRALITEQVFQTKDIRAQETLVNSQDIRDRAKPLQGQQGRRTDKAVAEAFSQFGLTGRDVGTLESTKMLFKNRKVDAIALAAAKNSAGTDKSRATLAELRKKYSAEDFAALEQEAAEITSGSSNETMTHLNRVLEAGKGGLANFAAVSENVGADMANQADKSVLEKIGKPNFKGDPVDALRDLTDKEIGNIKDPKLKAAALALKNHEKGAVDKARGAIADAGPKQTTEVGGGMTGLDTTDSDALISEVQKYKEQNASAEDGGDPQAQMWMSTAQILAGAAKDLKGAADIMKVKSGNPFWPIGGA